MIGYLVKEKKKSKSGKEFGIIPSVENYQNAQSIQNEYEKLEVNQKLKRESKVYKDNKYSCKHVNIVVNHDLII